LRLEDVVEDVLALAASESRRSSPIRTEIPVALPDVSGDRVELQQVLLNLLVNGMDAMSPSGIRRLLVMSRPCDT